MSAKTIDLLTYGGGALNPLSLIPIAPLATGVSTTDPTANTYNDAQCAFLQDLFALFSGSAFSITASENLSAGDIVNIWNSSGLKVRKANATDHTKPAHGFVKAAVTSGNPGAVYFSGEIDPNRSGLTAGTEYYLDTTGGALNATAPSGSGNLVQFIGVALSATSLLFMPEGFRDIAAVLDFPSNELITTIPLLISGGGATIATGYAGHTSVDYSGTIVGVTLLGKGSGSIVVDIYKTTYASFDGGATHPVAGDSICASAKPTISGATKAQDTALTGWTKTISAGDIIWFNVDSVTSFQNITLALKVQKS